MEVDRTGLEQGWEVTHPFTPTLKCLLKATTEGAAGKKKYHPPLSRPSSPAQDTFSGTNRKKLTGRDIGLFWVFSFSTRCTWRRKWQPTPGCMPGKFHGQGAWWAYSP